MTEELWRPVLGYEERYEVSNLGRVRSLWDAKRFYARPRETPLIRPPTIRKTGYVYITLNANRDQRQWAIHRLVLEAFVGRRPDGMECGHLDGNPANNRLENLAWVTKLENARHQQAHGRHVRGKDAPNAVLTEDKVKELRRRWPGETYAALAKAFGIHPSTAIQVIHRRKWAHVP